MADDPKPAADAPPAPAPPKKPAKPADQTIPGGAYVRSAVLGEDGQLYGGHVVNCDGETLAEFADDQVNDGKPQDRPANPRVRPKTLAQLRGEPEAPTPVNPPPPLTRGPAPTRRP